MIPLFKSTFSIGRSLLRVEDLVDIAQSGDVKKMILVEDNFYGFRVINKAFLHIEVPMVYGVKLPVVHSSITEKPSKLIFFPKNNKGVAVARNLYIKCFTSVGEYLNMSDLGLIKQEKNGLFLLLKDLLSWIQLQLKFFNLLTGREK